MDAKKLTKIGLLMMEPEAREERLAALTDGLVIHGDKLAALIDEARDACYVLTNEESKMVDEQQKIKIRWMLTEINGKDIVRNMDPDELVDWVVDLREHKGAFSKAELAETTRAIMGMK